MLHSATQRPATQKQAVEVEHPISGSKYHRADQSVVSETVANSYHGALCAPRAKLLNLCLRAPKGGEIQLVGPLSQLRNTRQLPLFHRADVDLKLQRIQDVIEAYDSLL